MPLSRLVVIGAGNMSRAILQGAATAGDPGFSSFLIVDPDERARKAMSDIGLAGRLEDTLAAVSDLPDRLNQHDAILLAVKPQMLGAVAQELQPILAEARLQPLVISILAGVPSGRVRERLGGGRVLRVMPNLPARVGLGMTAIAVGEGAAETDLPPALRLFETCGVVLPTSEDMLDAFTALAGSGPAYLFYLAEAMTSAAEEFGFGASDASLIVRQTLAGAAEMLRGSDESPSSLRAAVTSKGGTTAAATETFDRTGVMRALVEGMRAARARGAELAAKA